MRRVLLAAAATATLALVPAGPVGSATAPVPGSAGIDTSLPATDSQVTVSGRERFADLKITVNQTRDLVNQAISVTWTGGTPTSTGNSPFDAHYLQLFQCWGDDDGTMAGNPGPPPEQCQQGASTVAPFPPGSDAAQRVITRRNAPNFEETKAQGFFDDRTGLVWKPFRPVDGPAVTVHADPTFNPAISGGTSWLNPFFNAITTNEIPGGRTGPKGTGAELFEATTGPESSGLGCGQKVQTLADGSKKEPRCWLVIVPRGSEADENAGTGVLDGSGVATSPLAPAAWRNRIAVPLEFNPLDSPCPLSADQRRLVGSELLSAAVSSWQPVLCATPGLPPYAYGAIGDSRARQQLLSGVPSAPGLGVVSRPVDPATVDPQDPLVYAPLSLSGTVIAFNIERVPDAFKPNVEEDALAGLRVAQMNLTPRLVAKLLTQSYRSQVEIGASTPPYAWLPKNPPHLATDPDFLQFNPEFNLLRISNARNLGGLIVTSPSSDAARQVWEWVLSDPEAKAWLDGQADPWGMNVNTAYATTPAVNATGTAFGDPVPDTYPKSDQYCFQAPAFPSGVVPPSLCGIDWMPYTQSLRDAARFTRAANDGARIETNVFAVTPDKAYKAVPPQTLGARGIQAITDSASAAQYGLQTARLSRSGDDGPDRAFIAPDEAGLLAGVKAMTPKGVSTVLEPNPAAPGAYPLTGLTYAAVAPLRLDAQARKEYAAFVDYAAGPGQVPGRKLGQLPPGYAPLPPELRAQGTAAAARIRDLQATAEPSAESAGLGSGVPGTDESSGAPGGDEQGASEPAGGVAPGEPIPVPGPAPAPAPGPAPGPAPSIADRIAEVLTPIQRLAASRYLLVVLGPLAALAALGALEITKRPRRAAGSEDLAPLEPETPEEGLDPGTVGEPPPPETEAAPGLATGEGSSR